LALGSFPSGREKVTRVKDVTFTTAEGKAELFFGNALVYKKPGLASKPTW
jgi:hypothetical protein